MLNYNRKIDYRNGFSFSSLHYKFSKWIGHLSVLYKFVLDFRQIAAIRNGTERWHWQGYNKKLIRRWDSERELSLRRHRTRTTKYNRLLHKFGHSSMRRLRVGTYVYQIQWNNAM